MRTFFVVHFPGEPPEAGELCEMRPLGGVTLNTRFALHAQMMTTEGWADIAREVMANSGDGYSIFFVSFILIANILLANVVIAVLIEKVRNMRMQRKRCRRQS